MCSAGCDHSVKCGVLRVIMQSYCLNLRVMDTAHTDEVTEEEDGRDAERRGQDALCVSWNHLLSRDSCVHTCATCASACARAGVTHCKEGRRGGVRFPLRCCADLFDGRGAEQVQVRSVSPSPPVRRADKVPSQFRFARTAQCGKFLQATSAVSLHEVKSQHYQNCPMFSLSQCIDT